MQATDTTPSLLQRARVLAREVRRMEHYKLVFPATLAIAEGVLAEPVGELQGALAGELALDEELEAEARMVDERARENADYDNVFTGGSRHYEGQRVSHVTGGVMGTVTKVEGGVTAVRWDRNPDHADDCRCNACIGALGSPFPSEPVKPRSLDRTVTLDAEAAAAHGDALKIGCPTCTAGIGELCDHSGCLDPRPLVAHEARYLLAWRESQEGQRCASCGATLIFGECGGALGCVKGCLDFTGIGKTATLSLLTGRSPGRSTVTAAQRPRPFDTPPPGANYGAALDVDCPTCHRPAGELCKLGDTDGHRGSAHLARYEAADAGFVGVFKLDAQLAAEQAFDAERRRYGAQGVHVG